MQFRVFITAALLSLLAAPALAADEIAPNHRPVKAVGEYRIDVEGRGALPLFLSRDWAQPSPQIDRAVLVLHGRLREADVYFKTALGAQAAAGPAGATTLMIAPQFLADVDVSAHGLAADTLRWTWEGWEGGEPATGPSPASSFEALDAILARLADRRLFPNLKHIVVAGHSGGAQVVQRYAIAGHGEAAAGAGISLRYVVANPSSYAYFTLERPEPAIAAACPGYDDWKYGMRGRPEYLAAATPAALEAQYASRRVIYLLGALDVDPQHPALDKSCMARAQGPYRYARGHFYAASMAARHPGAANHIVHDIAGVGHDGDRMFRLECGLAALFDVAGCGG